MIVLIGNLVATGLRAVESGFVSSHRRNSFVSTAESPDPGNRRAAVDSSGRTPFRVRQKYLLGYRVDVNRAGAGDLSGIPGISDGTAEAWVAERKRLGGFRHPRQLLRVRGIGEKRLKKILPFLSGFHNN